MVVARIKGTLPKSYVSGPNRKPGHWQWNGEEAISERGFGGQYNGTLRLTECEV